MFVYIFILIYYLYYIYNILIKFVKIDNYIGDVYLKCLFFLYIYI